MTIMLEITPTAPPAPIAPRACLLSRADFALLVGQYSERLEVVARRFFRSAEDAADALQEALLAAYANRASFQGQATVYTWLYRIVVNTCLMQLRARRIRSRRLPEAPHTAGELPAEPCAAASLRPAAALEAAEMHALLHEKLRLLPADFRAVLELRDLGELSTRATAARLQLSEEAVKTRVYRARQALRKLLAASGDESCVGPTN